MPMIKTFLIFENPPPSAFGLDDISSKHILPKPGLTSASLCVAAGGLPAPFAEGRPLGSALYFMVTPGSPVRLHRIRNDQLYHYYLGDPIEVFLLHADGTTERIIVGPPFGGLSEKSAKREIEEGVAAVAKVLGGCARVAPFFRFPGLGRSSRLENYLNGRSLSIWSADIVADDWLDITPQELVQRTLTRINERKSGILLLHDIQRRTATALPLLLRELDQRGYRFVHVLFDSRASRLVCH